MLKRTFVTYLNKALILGLILAPLQLQADPANSNRASFKAERGQVALNNDRQRPGFSSQQREHQQREQRGRENAVSQGRPVVRIERDSRDERNQYDRNSQYDRNYRYGQNYRYDQNYRDDRDRTSLSVSLNYNRYADYGYRPVRYSPGKPRVIVINNYHRPRPYLVPSFYYRRDLPSGFTFAISAGITYAIVDSMYYYRHTGDRYVYVESPRPGNYRVVESDEFEGTIKPGTVVFGVPGTAEIVIYNDQTYYLDEHDWYLALAGEPGRYVVVENPLY